MVTTFRPQLLPRSASSATAVRPGAQGAQAFMPQVERRTDASRSGSWATAFHGSPQPAPPRATKLPYMTKNATGGLASRRGGRGFGVEIEFAVPLSQRMTQLDLIGRELRDRGLLTDHRMRDPRDYRGEPAATKHEGGWRFLSDPTLNSGGELVSPILFDDVETWQALRSVTESLRRNGATTGPTTGLHVHVGTGDIPRGSPSHLRLAELVTEYQPALYKLAKSPERLPHQPRPLSRPLNNDGFEDFDSLPQHHDSALDFRNVKGKPSDHVEFRLWDGSLDESVIQTYAKTSLALVNASTRSSPRGGIVGTREGSRLEMARLAEDIFARPEDRMQVLALYGLTQR